MKTYYVTVLNKNDDVKISSRVQVVCAEDRVRQEAEKLVVEIARINSLPVNSVYYKLE